MPCFLRGLVELDRAVHDAVVGQAERRLVERRRALGELVDLARAVEQRVLGVDVEVGAGRRGHGPSRIGPGPDISPPPAHGAFPRFPGFPWRTPCRIRPAAGCSVRAIQPRRSARASSSPSSVPVSPGGGSTPAISASSAPRVQRSVRRVGSAGASA